SAEAEWDNIMALTRATRTLRNEYHIEPSSSVAASILARTPEVTAFWKANAELLGALPGTRLGPIQVVESASGAPAELAARSIGARRHWLGSLEAAHPSSGGSTAHRLARPPIASTPNWRGVRRRARGGVHRCAGTHGAGLRDEGARAGDRPAGRLGGRRGHL